MAPVDTDSDRDPDLVEPADNTQMRPGATNLAETGVDAAGSARTEMSSFFRPRSFCVSLLSVFALGSGFAAPPRLLPPDVGASEVALQLQGDAGSTYRLESSIDLRTWIAVGSGVAGNGILSIRAPRPANASAVYYRGVQVPGEGRTFPTVVARTATNTIGGGIVVAERETTVTLQGAGGVSYSLVFATNAVAEPTLVTLTELETLGGLPAEKGLLAGVRIDPEGLVLAAPVSLRIDFPSDFEARRVSSFTFANDGSRLHLVPDVVVRNATTRRVRILVNQLRSYGCAVFSLSELEALASSTPPPRRSGSRSALHADLEECYPGDAVGAKAMQEQLEDRIAPKSQEMARILGIERQNALLGVADETAGTAAMSRVLEISESFYRDELATRIPEAGRSCAAGRTLLPWVLGAERQRQLLGVRQLEPVPGGATAADLVCNTTRSCQSQALECCRTKGGDTRLIREVVGAERQRQLLFGDGAECAGASIEDAVKECAPDWYGTVSVRTRGDYLDVETNSTQRVRRTSRKEVFLHATVVSARVRKGEESLFSPAYTNLVCVLEGTYSESGRDEKLQESRDSACMGKPVSWRRDVWEHGVETNLTNIRFEAVILAPGTDGIFLFPYFEFGTGTVTRDQRWQYVEETNFDSEFSDEDCVTTTRTGGSYDPGGGDAGLLLGAKRNEFEWTADTIRYSIRRPEPMRFDFQHLFEGTTEIEVDLRRVR